MEEKIFALVITGLRHLDIRIGKLTDALNGTDLSCFYNDMEPFTQIIDILGENIEFSDTFYQNIYNAEYPIEKLWEDFLSEKKIKK